MRLDSVGTPTILDAQRLGTLLSLTPAAAVARTRIVLRRDGSPDAWALTPSAVHFLGERTQLFSTSEYAGVRIVAGGRYEGPPAEFNRLVVTLDGHEVAWSAFPKPCVMDKPDDWLFQEVLSREPLTDNSDANVCDGCL